VEKKVGIFDDNEIHHRDHPSKYKGGKAKTAEKL
jgi:hypothetical protein